MRHTLTLLTLCITLHLHAQVKYYAPEPPPVDLHIDLWKGSDGYKWKWQQYIAPASLAFAAGICQGYNETLMHHYGAFQKRHPNANPDFWDPRRSWVNKWELGPDGKALVGQERFWLSSSALVMFTDGYHLTDSGNYFFLQASYSLVPEHQGKPLSVKAGEALGIWLLRKAGFHLVYSVIYKQ